MAAPRRICQGADGRPCGVSIPATRDLCHFCRRTRALLRSTDPMKGRAADGPRGVPERTSVREPAGGDLHSVAAAHPVTAARPALQPASQP